MDDSALRVWDVLVVCATAFSTIHSHSATCLAGCQLSDEEMAKRARRLAGSQAMILHVHRYRWRFRNSEGVKGLEGSGYRSLRSEDGEMTVR